METILIMIVVGVVSMIFGKAKNNQGQTGRKPTGNRPVNIQTMFKEITDNLPKDTRSMKEENKPKLPETSLNELEKEYQQVRQESEASRMRIAAVRTPAANRENANGQEKINYLIPDHPDSQTVINGIIWAEILGEPRSKNPYRVKKHSS
ncbi:hypothetical protein [Neobacillus vireti]|uniref:hypothetical protein n=1 Tax=Neobacillus vireti TaxID=220686 RepID=UPI0030001796